MTNISNFNEEIKKEDDEEFNENQFILFKQFFDAKQKFKKLDEIFDLVKEYEDLCSDYLTVMSNLKRQKTSHSLNSQLNFSLKLKQTLKSELFAWRLIRSLYEDRLKGN